MTILMMTYAGISWTTAPFMHCLYKHWPNQRVVLAAEKNYAPEFPHEFIQPPQGKDSEIHNDAWGDALAWCLDQIEDEHVIIMHPDYWLWDAVDQSIIDDALAYGESFENVLRMNIGHGYGFASGGELVDMFRGIGIKECTRYPENSFHMASLTPAIWNRKLMRSVIKTGNNWTSWTFEEKVLESLYIGDNTHLRSVAIVPEPMKFSNVIFSRNNDDLKIHESLEEEVKKYIPDGKRIVYYREYEA